MKETEIKKIKQAKPDIRKVATRKVTNVTNEDLKVGFGIWEGKNISLDEIREKSWGRK